MGDGIESAYLTHTKDHKEYFPMADALTLRRDVFTSNLPEREKTALARVLSRVGGSGGDGDRYYPRWKFKCNVSAYPLLLRGLERKIRLRTK